MQRSSVNHKRKESLKKYGKARFSKSRSKSRTRSRSKSTKAVHNRAWNQHMVKFYDVSTSQSRVSQSKRTSIAKMRPSLARAGSKCYNSANTTVLKGKVRSKNGNFVMTQ